MLLTTHWVALLFFDKDKNQKKLFNHETKFVIYYVTHSITNQILKKEASSNYFETDWFFLYRIGINTYTWYIQKKTLSKNIGINVKFGIIVENIILAIFRPHLDKICNKVSLVTIFAIKYN